MYNQTVSNSTSKNVVKMRCVSCKEEYQDSDAGTCKECYEEASETEEELKREIDELKSKVSFLSSWSPFDDHHHHLSSSSSSSSFFSDVLLVATDDESPPVPANKAVLVSRSPVFKAMLETEMEESRSGTIKISDVSYNVLRSFIHYLYTAEVPLTEPMACDLLVLAERYQVKHLKSYCEKFMTSKVNGENAIVSFAFANQHNAKHLLEASLSVVMDNMDKLTKQDDYKDLVEKDPRLVVGIYEAYLAKQVNTAAASSK
ncbi:BTB/POZ-like [Macleaya cordata]|uniref:BTB/POZ-like n=1 Tax=Macleaya cordata TaxID=56857 RepID=A0A200R0C0_MACCD|nr:BTB/POZ-like [Macleaya cordata]